MDMEEAEEDARDVKADRERPSAEDVLQSIADRINRLATLETLDSWALQATLNDIAHTLKTWGFDV